MRADVHKFYLLANLLKYGSIVARYVNAATARKTLVNRMIIQNRMELVPREQIEAFIEFKLHISRQLIKIFFKQPMISDNHARLRSR